MKHLFAGISFSLLLLFLIINFKPVDTAVNPDDDMLSAEASSDIHSITGFVKRKETLQTIFSKYKLNAKELNDIYHSARNEYNLSKIVTGSVYSFEIDKTDNRILNMQYGIDDMTFLNVIRDSDGFNAEKITLKPEIRIGSLYLNIKDSLILSMPSQHREYQELALKLSDIYAWDIDFSSDIRNGDSVKIIVEELWVGEVFKGFGDILAAEFVNDHKTLPAYRFEHGGYADYYDDNGKSVKKALLRSPLKFKHISSGFSKRRFHPVLRIYRPHLGIDYAAPTGTPVSAAGSGTIKFAGYKGQNGRMVRIKHRGGYETYYGHLSRIPKKIKRGARVSQGDIIGYVGSTGLATGPHLDYRMKLNGRFVNPLKVRLPRGESVPGNMMTEFRKTADYFNTRLASLTRPIIAFKHRGKVSG